MFQPYYRNQIRWSVCVIRLRPEATRSVICIFAPLVVTYVLKWPTRKETHGIAKVQMMRWIASSLNEPWYGSMEWNMEENFGMEWKGRFFVWNGYGREENCWNGNWKNHLPFHSIPCPAQKRNIQSHVGRMLLLLQISINVHPGI